MGFASFEISETNFDECHFIESSKAELLAHSLEGAPFNPREEDAHISETGTQLHLCVGAVVFKGLRPPAHLAIHDADRQEEGRRGYHRGREDQHALLNQCQLYQVLSQVE